MIPDSHALKTLDCRWKAVDQIEKGYDERCRMHFVVGGSFPTRYTSLLICREWLKLCIGVGYRTFFRCVESREGIAFTGFLELSVSESWSSFFPKNFLFEESFV